MHQMLRNYKKSLKELSWEPDWGVYIAETSYILASFVIMVLFVTDSNYSWIYFIYLALLPWTSWNNSSLFVIFSISSKILFEIEN